MPQITNLRFERAQAPFLGIGCSRPRLSWSFSSTDNDEQDWTQTAYEVKIARGNVGVDADAAFPNCTIQSGDNLFVPWPFAPLSSRERAVVSVRVQGSTRRSRESRWSEWIQEPIEIGLLSKADWSCHMISGEMQDSAKAKRPTRFRTTVEIRANRNLKTARLYITALGVYEAYINGQRVGDQYLAPGWTDYRFRIAYQVFDVGHLVKPGKNVLAAWVGDGWYSGRFGIESGEQRNNYGDRLGLWAQLEIDGVEIARTEAESGSWQWAFGSILQSELYNGETWDADQALREQGWDSADCGTADMSAWQPVESLPSILDTITSIDSPPVKEQLRIPGQELLRSSSGRTIIDFGQNLAGFVCIKSVPPDSSSRITLQHAEVLEHGELGVRPLRTAKATETITLSPQSGHLVKGYSPKFTFHGFRYVQVDGWDGVRPEDIEAVVIQSSMRRTGTFECSHPLINRLYQNVVWSTMGNTISVPTDCPQRDERLGWTGDIAVFTPTLSYMYEADGFLSSWLKDLADDQATPDLNGNVAVVIPNILKKASNKPFAIWGDSAVTVPWDLYLATGDTKILQDQWPSARMWLDQGVLRDAKGLLWSKQHPQLSDWLHPAASPRRPAIGPTDNHLVADAWLIGTTRMAVKWAEVIEDDKAVKQYTVQIQNMIEEFHRQYVTRDGRILSDTQTALVLILHFDVFPPPPSSSIFSLSSPSSYNPEKHRQQLQQRLGELVRQDLWSVSTGFAGTPLVLRTLAASKLHHHAYRMLQGGTSPSWLSCVKLGATTIWERWDSMLADGTINPGEMTSFNHYALGSVAQFLHETTGGLSPLEPSWKKVLVAPMPGGTIRSAKTSFEGPHGLVYCEWAINVGAKNGQVLVVKTEVPPNTTAIIRLPGSSDVDVGSGRREYTVPWEDDVRFPPKPLEDPFSSPTIDVFIP
ncbi:bacterial alpha-L-rhamnosidase-domain-containing protein [Kockovaella imperatae]|uniref:alpha-L-rhamnosidase n=1 Tax=Kockovaella imperatae TaxID=4999 RepID=A0A1Y1U7S4_9TREE|nr:bacterial alpha-L-rhamnosidase-domain-containing protein [Kockovaella imperatae]ORX34052.1 bacterial alpha-L-rhamnosidase-domain-containing protein [Kockovaella imperatae]